MHAVSTIRLDGVASPTTENSGILPSKPLVLNKHDQTLDVPIIADQSSSKLGAIFAEHFCQSDGWFEQHRKNGDMWFRGEGPYAGLDKESAWELRKHISSEIDKAHDVHISKGRSPIELIGFNGDLWFSGKGPYAGLTANEKWELKGAINAAIMSGEVSPVVTGGTVPKHLMWVLAFSAESELWAKELGPYAGLSRDDARTVKKQRETAINNNFEPRLTRAGKEPAYAGFDL